MVGSSPQTVNTSDMDRVGFSIYVALMVIGWLMVYAVNYNEDAPLAFMDFSNPAGKQGVFLLVSLTLVFFIFLIEWSAWRTFALALYGGALLLLIAVLFFGKTVKGNTAWFQFGGFSLQPSEFAKFGTCLAMAAHLSVPSVNLRNYKDRFLAFAIFAVPMLLILLQPDTGSALVFLSFFLVLYREGISGTWYALAFGAAAMVILGLIFSPPFVIAALLLLASIQLLRKLRNPRLGWILWVFLVVLFVFWNNLIAWVNAQSVPDAVTTADGVQAATPLFLQYADWGLALLTALFYGILFFINYRDRNVPKRSGLRMAVTLIALGSLLSIAANFVVFSVLQPHQQERIKVWLRPEECDPRGSLYNVLHSQMAIGSGGLMGKGYLEGTMTKLKYVPEQTTDFIFCTIGEEQGFIGSLATILLFALLIYRVVSIAERQRSPFSRVYAYCVAGILLLHFTINIGMTMGLFPIIGIPLPFISYGGSALIAFSLMMGVLFKLDSHRYLA